MSGSLQAAGIAAAAALAMSVPLPTAAQTTAQTTARYDSPVGVGYIGGSIGTTRTDRDCVAGFACDDDTVGGKIFLGNRFGRYFGAELAYVRPGNIDLAGGTQEAEGVALSLLGFLPLANDRFEIFGRVGTTYGWTSTSAAPGFPSGDEKGFEPHYGVGAAYNFTSNVSARIEWERHRFEWAGGNDDELDLFSVGVAYRFNQF